MEKEKIAVIGAGAWGTTLANYLAKRDHPVSLWAYEPEVCEAIRSRRENPQFLPGVSLHPGISPTNRLSEAAQGASLILSAVPSQVVRSLWQTLSAHLASSTDAVSVSKGLETSSLLTMTQVIREAVPDSVALRLAALSGPTFASEVSQGYPTAAVVASKEPGLAQKVQTLLSGPSLRLYTHDDVLGVELGGALKNVMALGAGISDGLGLGYNARAALIVRGMAEMARLGEAMGACAQTFAGLAGFGDLVLTCTGDASRNRTLGLRIGGGEKLKDILQGMRTVAEGVEASRAARQLGERFHTELPITEKVCQILFEGKPARKAMGELMARELKPEFA